MNNRLCLTAFAQLSYMSGVQAQEKHTSNQLTENVSEHVSNVDGTLTVTKTIEVHYTRGRSLEKAYQVEAKKGDIITIQATAPHLQDLRFAFCRKPQKCQPVSYPELAQQQVVRESGIYLLQVDAAGGGKGQDYYKIVISVAHGRNH